MPGRRRSRRCRIQAPGRPACASAATSVPHARRSTSTRSIPPRMVEAGLQGKVSVEAVIGVDGRVVQEPFRPPSRPTPIWRRRRRRRARMALRADPAERHGGRSGHERVRRLQPGLSGAATSANFPWAMAKSIPIASSSSPAAAAASARPPRGSPRARLRGVRELSSRAEAAADAVVAAIDAAGGRAIAVAGRRRRSRPTSCGCSRPATRELGTLTALVNNAGILETQMRVEAMDARAAAARLSPPTSSARSSARARRCAACRRGTAAAAAPSSTSRRWPRASARPGEYVDYAASKGAIDTFTIGLAREVAAGGHPRQRRAPRRHLHRHPRQRRRARTASSGSKAVPMQRGGAARGSRARHPVAAVGRGGLHRPALSSTCPADADRRRWLRRTCGARGRCRGLLRHSRSDQRPRQIADGVLAHPARGRVPTPPAVPRARTPRRAARGCGCRCCAAPSSRPS